ncbi:alpha/beta-hydrolase [Melanomma pulvis-pyrius CBS 109.77]|uniref:Carboxylic ester hydrolase n=1 Tax=Melanomma pulvis-pyrius CBS 109.77 TaxID=1314802 RepID=A0A6A6WVR0_9PLEO|nr:alpha/beta-hydrolase [Melanomma pulvis-pyrius CBS 109.77]
MTALIGIVAAAYFACSCATAVPSPSSIASELTILTHNDLYGNASPRQAAVIVLGARQSLAIAESNCAAVGETLWNPGNTSEELGFLRYLDYGKTIDELGVYWIGGKSGCRAITTAGKIQTVSCDTHFPALCSQSAPMSSPSSSDTALQWQMSIKAGNTEIVGYRDRLSYRFLGLRYASRPARFGYSKYQPLSNVTSISALEYGPRCVQSGCNDATCSEDCLYLNIWTPYLPNGKSSSSTKKAVMLWIHGGGFTGGTGSDTTFDGGNMASRGDVVVVTINYRLSTLGFLALDNTTLRGNYGLGDQITALDWVRAHIGDFGGDKDRITVFGQSAGAASVRALLASPQAKGKFSRAIMQSNPAGVQYASTFSHYLTISEATELTKAILNETNCTQTDKSIQLACLRAQDPVKLVSGTVARYPVVDGTYLTSKELPLYESAPAIDVALMTGIMRDDGGPFSKFSKTLNASQALTEQGFDSADILDKFPVPKGSNATIDIFNLTARVTTDAEFRCLGQSTAFVGSKGIFPVVYSYEFDRAYQIVEWNPNPPTCTAPITASYPYGDTSQPYFRCHSGELYYVFGTLIRQGQPPRDEDDIPFSQYIVDTWTAFGREKDPNPSLDFLTARGFTNTSAIVKKSNPWIPVQEGKATLRILDTGVRDETFKEVDQCIVLKFPLDYYSK